MDAMQYSVPLPADYDMQIIRDRVARTGHLLDGFAGLDLKAYLIREKAAGAPANEYAPFYLWRDLAGMRAFCWGEPGYSAIVRDFGRRPIEDWTVAGVTVGAAPLTDARTLRLSRHPMPEGIAPSQAVGPMTEDFLAGTTPRTVRRVAAVDVTTWTVLLADLSAEAAATQQDPDAAVYEVLHVSPGAAG